MKRKPHSTSPDRPPKRLKQSATDANAALDTPAPSRPRRPRMNKLVPPRPFPTVPTSVSATGPRSAHTAGKNYICITRKTPLGAYLRRCKDAILKDGYKTVHLSAMGAAIPHLVFLAVSLPQILPFAADEMRTEYLTGTVEVTDEVFPEDEDEDVSYQTRGKSTLSVVLTIGDGDSEHAGGSGSVGGQGKGRRAKKAAGKVVGKEKAAARPPQVVFQEPEQDDMDIG